MLYNAPFDFGFYLWYRSCLQPSQDRDFNAAAQYFSDIVPPIVARSIITEMRFRKAKQKCVEDFLEKNVLPSNEVQKTMDNVGISRQGYSQLYKALRGKLADNKIKGSLFPRPVQGREAQNRINGVVMDMLGDPMHIIDIYQGKKKALKFDEYNNDLQTL